MRGTVLLLDGGASRGVDVAYFRANELIVYEAARPEDALEQLDTLAPDVVVAFVDPAADDTSVVRALRSRIDEATSLIVVASDLQQELREQHRAAGADSLLSRPAGLSEVLYEVRRALILRRSGRRLPWNWREEPEPPSRWWSRVLGTGTRG